MERRRWATSSSGEERRRRGEDPLAAKDPWATSASEGDGLRQRDRHHGAEAVGAAKKVQRAPPASVEEALWLLASRIGSAYRLCKGDCYVLDMSLDQENFLAELSGLLQRLGTLLLPSKERARHLLPRPEVRELINLLALLATRSNEIGTEDKNIKAAECVDEHPERS